ncbi:transmembrane protein 187-like [Limulus polyphemus]|uniref:Transmembrane protein 187-like n=1 Tax=Limulus polyphemus TaxID=6850 RepID=A0ABM1SSR1_LIMPO|nr:transmembrane protein 187-like [Limulus polyphemus]
MGIIVKAGLHVCVIILFMELTILTGLFDKVHTECGYQFYAETSYKVPSLLPSWLKMPANSLINSGYIAVGMYGLWLSRKFYHKPDFCYCLAIFSWMAICYGPIQFCRIVTQNHRAAVLDQWVTLPFFAWVIVWCISVCNVFSKSWSMCISCLSVMSYFLTLLTIFGFEIALGLHIAVAIGATIYAQHKYGDSTSFLALIGALANCCGFVFLKLYDHELARWQIFQTLTGHFWSKVCDCLQIYFVCKFYCRLNPDMILSQKIRKSM